MLIHGQGSTPDPLSSDDLDQLLYLLENGSVLALKRMAFLRNNWMVLSSPDLSGSQAIKLMTVLLNGCASEDANERACCAELMLHRMLTDKQGAIGGASLLSSIELHLRAAEGKVKLDLVELIIVLLQDKDWFEEMLNSSSLLQYLVKGLPCLSMDQVGTATQLSGFQTKQRYSLAQDTFISAFFTMAESHGFIDRGPAKGFGRDQDLSELLEEGRICPMDEFRIHIILGDRFDVRDDVQLGDEEMAHSMMHTLVSICKGSAAACKALVEKDGMCSFMKRCLIDKQRKTKVVLETLALIEIMMRESSDAEMHCIMKEREFGYLLFEMLSLQMHEEVISVPTVVRQFDHPLSGFIDRVMSSVLKTMQTMFLKSDIEDLEQTLDVGLGNFLSLISGMVGLGKTSSMLEWYDCLDALMASSVRLPDANAVAMACCEGLRVDYFPPVVQACWSALSHLSLPGIIQRCSCMHDVLSNSIEVVKSMPKQIVTHDGCLYALLSWVRTMLQNSRLLEGKSEGEARDAEDWILKHVQSVLVVRIMENFGEVADSTVMSLLLVLTDCMNVGGAEWSLDFARTYANAGFTGTIISWIQSIMLHRDGCDVMWQDSEGCDTMVKAYAMSGSIFLHRFLEVMNFMSPGSEGFYQLSQMTFEQMLSMSGMGMVALSKSESGDEWPKTEDDKNDLINLVVGLASILACALFHGDQNVCEVMVAQHWISTVLNTGFHVRLSEDKYVMKNLLTIHTIATQATWGVNKSDGGRDLHHVLEIVSTLTREQVICDPEIVHCLWKAYGDQNPELAEELLCLWLDARTDPALAHHLHLNEALMKSSIFSNPASLPVFVSMLRPMSSCTRLLSMLDLIRHVPEHVSEGLVAADFLQGAHQVLMCLTSEEVASAMIPTITHLLCSAPSPGIMGHHRACLQLSRRLSQRLFDRGVHTGADVILCLAALCDRHLDIDDVLNVMAKCGPVIVSLLHEVENPEVDLIRPALCIVALVWCAHGQESAQQMQNDDRFFSVAEELVSAFIMSTRRLLKSTAACEKAVGILCTSFLTASFMDHISSHDFEWMAEESLVVCQQAMMDPEWPNSIKASVINTSLETLLMTCGTAGQVASLPWHKTVVEYGIDLLCSTMSQTHKERQTTTYKQHMCFMLPWLGFVSIMANEGATWISDIVTDELCTMLLQSTSDSIPSRTLFIAHVNCWKALMKRGLVKVAHESSLRMLITGAFHGPQEERRSQSDDFDIEWVDRWSAGGDSRGLQPMLFKRITRIASSPQQNAKMDQATQEVVAELLQALQHTR